MHLVCILLIFSEKLKRVVEVSEEKVREEKGTQTQTFWSDTFGWGRGLPREGVVAKKFGMSFETQGNQTFRRDA